MSLLDVNLSITDTNFVYFGAKKTAMIPATNTTALSRSHNGHNVVMVANGQTIVMRIYDQRTATAWAAVALMPLPFNEYDGPCQFMIDSKATSWVLQYWHWHSMCCLTADASHSESALHAPPRLLSPARFAPSAFPPA